MSEIDIQNMLASLWPTNGTPNIIDFYDDETGQWMRLTAQGISLLIINEAPNDSL